MRHTFSLTVLLLVVTLMSFAATLATAEYRMENGKSKKEVQAMDTTPRKVVENGETATFAAGCFWGVEFKFSQVPGVLSTRVGYTGGTTKNPTYEEVCTDETGHAEAVEVTYDPAKVSYEKLLDVFFGLHDPTQVNRQGPDVGTQYRSAIFYHDEAQKKTAEATIAALNAAGKYRRPIATQVVPAGPFYPAEEYHQKYYQKRGKQGCGI